MEKSERLDCCSRGVRHVSDFSLAELSRLLTSSSAEQAYSEFGCSSSICEGMFLGTMSVMGESFSLSSEDTCDRIECYSTELMSSKKAIEEALEGSFLSGRLSAAWMLISTIDGKFSRMSSGISSMS